MIRQTEKWFIRKVNKIGNTYYGEQYVRRTTYWLFWIIPIFIKEEVVKGDYDK